MNYTNTFNFAKPAGEDKVDVSVLNSNMDILDQTLTAGGGTSLAKTLTILRPNWNWDIMQLLDLLPI